MLFHVPRFIGNNGCARSTCGAQKVWHPIDCYFVLSALRFVIF